jgi:hypothetical protein
MDKHPEYPDFPDYPHCLIDSWVPLVDPLTWYARSEVVDDRFLVSILTAPGHWAEFTITLDDMTHRLAVAVAVNRLTGRTVADVTASLPAGDACSSYRVSVDPAPDTVHNGHTDATVRGTTV